MVEDAEERRKQALFSRSFKEWVVWTALDASRQNFGASLCPAH